MCVAEHVGKCDATSLDSIGDLAFGDCLALEEIIIPNGVKRIGDGIFHGCRNLNFVFLPDTLTNISPDFVVGIHKSHNLTVICNDYSYANEYCCKNRIRTMTPSEYNSAHKYNLYGSPRTKGNMDTSSNQSTSEKKPGILSSIVSIVILLAIIGGIVESCGGGG
jgi:hypothetical protein